MNVPNRSTFSMTSGGEVPDGVRGVTAALGLAGNLSSLREAQQEPLNLGLYAGMSTYNMPCDQIPPDDVDGLANRIRLEELRRIDRERIIQSHEASTRARHQQLFVQTANEQVNVPLPDPIAHRLDSSIVLHEA